MTLSGSKVGIFWCVGESVIGEAVELADAEPYGDALQYGGHYDFWSALKPQTPAERQFKSHAYDYYPRGRVVYFQSQHQFRLYVDGCMDHENRMAVVDYFCLSVVKIDIERDAHYRCSRCNRFYFDEIPTI